jgi:CHAT domain-containing protein/tetratricopeptide (TPR) repeat protein
MWRRTLLVVLLSWTPLLFAAAPPLGPDTPLTAEERQTLAEQLQRVFAVFQKENQAGRVKEALAAAREGVALHERLEGSRSEKVAGALEWIARQSSTVGADEQAIRYWERAYHLRQRLHGESHWRVIDARWELKDARTKAKWDRAAREQWQRSDDLYKQAGWLLAVGKWKEAVPLAEEALTIRRKLLGEKHPEVARSLSILGGRHHDLQQVRQAEACYLQARDVFKETLGEKHPDYAVTLNNLGSVYQDMGELTRSRPLLEQALGIYKETLGEKHAEYATSLNNLAMLYHRVGEYGLARPLFEQALTLRKEVLGRRHPSYAQSVDNLGRLNQAVGENARARSLYEQALALRKEVLGEKHPEYAISLNNLGLQFMFMGEYPRARPLLEQALAINKEALGQKHPDYVTNLNNLAALYKEVGEYTRARALMEQVVALTRETKGERYPDYAGYLSNLAVLYREMGEPARAKPLVEQIVALRKEVLGQRHPDYAASLNSLALVNLDLGDDARARPLLEQALALSKEALGEKHPRYADILNNLGMLCHDMGEYDRGRSLLEQTLALIKEVQGEKHPRYAQCLNSLAMLNWREGKPAVAGKQMGQVLQITHQHLDDTFSALSHRQQLQLLAQSRHYLDGYLCVSAQTKLPPAVVYEAVLAWKGMAGARAAEEQLLRDQPTLAPLLEQLRLKRAGLAHLSSHPPTPASLADWRRHYRELDKEREELEYRLVQQSAAFRALRSLNGKVVAAALPERAALVDLLEYSHPTPDPGSKGKWLFERRLVAFVAARGKEVARVELGAVRPIALAVAAWRRAMQTLFAVDEKAARQLRELLWDKLKPALGEVDTVLVAPDGVLCALPWCALPGSEPGTFLIEEVTIAQLASARQLLPGSAVSVWGLLCVGGLDYGKGEAAAGSWSALPGTELEARRVAALHRSAFPAGRPPRLLGGAAVGKEALTKAVAGEREGERWRYLHLATHGYFLPRQRLVLDGAESRGLAGEVEVSAAEIDPLLGCGLVLSGANADPERGTLTALEVSNLDLRGCELVVLSACESGLGKLESGEGVLGLQRAFHLAGARTVVSSLWSVSDPATSVLMEQFYSNLWGERPMTRLEALRRAQLYVLRHPEAVRQRARELRAEVVKAGRGSVEELRGKGKEVELVGKKEKGERSHPGWWAAFVLSGDIGVVKP